MVSVRPLDVSVAVHMVILLVNDVPRALDGLGYALHYATSSLLVMFFMMLMVAWVKI